MDLLDRLAKVYISPGAWYPPAGRTNGDRYEAEAQAAPPHDEGEPPTVAASLDLTFTGMRPASSAPARASFSQASASASASTPTRTVTKHSKHLHNPPHRASRPACRTPSQHTPQATRPKDFRLLVSSR
jgi:hypothetical protein